MHKLTFTIITAALLMAFAPHSLATPDTEQGKVALGSMTVNELETTADNLRAQKDYREAIRYFKVALSKEPKNAVLYNKLGISQMQLGDYRGSRSSFEKAIKLDAQYSDAFNNLGAVAYVQKKYDKAAKQFKKALALDETRATFHVNLGAAWFAQGKMDRAVTEYTRAFELDPDVLGENSKAGVIAQISTPEERARYDYMLAKIYARRGDVERCLQCLKRAKEGGYPDMEKVYKDPEFASLRQDARLSEVVPSPHK
jgi:Flp pilus assembly protein TadD